MYASRINIKPTKRSNNNYKQLETRETNTYGLLFSKRDVNQRIHICITSSMCKNKKIVDILYTKQSSTAKYGNFFLRQLEMQDRPVSNIRTYQGGELARSSEFCDMIHSEFQCGLQMIRTYSS